MKEKHAIRDKFLGCILGFAVGDALGLPFRGTHIQEIEGVRETLKEMATGESTAPPPGEGGENTQQMMLTLDSILMNKGIEIEDIAFCLGEILDEEDHPRQPELSMIIKGLKESPEDWKKTARLAWLNSAGTFSTNGNLRRTIPVALRYYNDMDKMVENTILVSQLTHHDPRCIDAALAINFLLVQCLHGNFTKGLGVQAATFINALRKHPVYKDSVMDFDAETLSTQMNMTPYSTWSENRDEIIQILRESRGVSYYKLGSSPNVIHSLQAAIWSLVECESFEDGVSFMVGLGGESDLQAALAGALLGARDGLKSIPTAWLKGLENRPRLINLGELLLTEL
jgi:ADP-ribosylglycohydrolase